ncbi:MAG: DUF4405 domain-containing protein [Euryarchaeota archaeon]|nr:DUF4405 domain-containing protein [Euryarchaeota archaeon]
MGVIIWLYLPGFGALRVLGTGFSEEFLGITRRTWLDANTYLGLLFVALVALHLVLHWSYESAFQSAL